MVSGTIDFWQFVGGIGLFLFAMAQLEAALASFGGSAFRTYLRTATDRPIKAVMAGTIVTALLQSSSLVGLLVLAFVGAGIMSLANALGVIFGANLGTTVTGWLVAMIGFKLDIEGLSLPLIGLGSLVLVTVQGRASEFGRLAAAIGFLLMGLAFMKDSVGALADAIGIERLAGFALWQFLLFGVVFAAVVQSSSAVLMLTLTALHATVIDVPSSAAIVIGANFGTTSTMVVGAIQGGVGKRRVAIAHVIFNAATALVAFVLLAPMLALMRLLGLVDPLYGLVAFHTMFNLLGIILFLPVIHPFARFLEHRFGGGEVREARFVGETAPDVPEAAIVALCEETAHIIDRVARHNMRVFTPPLPLPPGRLPVDTAVDLGEDRQPFDVLYRRNKTLEGEIVSFAVKLQAQPLEEAQSRRLNELLAAVRQAVRSAKSLRDVRHNLDEFYHSPDPRVNAYLDHFRSVMTSFYGELFRLRDGDGTGPVAQDFELLRKRIGEWYEDLQRQIYTSIRRGEVGEYETSSLLNVNREIWHSNGAVIDALEAFESADIRGLEARPAPASAT